MTDLLGLIEAKLKTGVGTVIDEGEAREEALTARLLEMVQAQFEMLNAQAEAVHKQEMDKNADIHAFIAGVETAQRAGDLRIEEAVLLLVPLAAHRVGELVVVDRARAVLVAADLDEDAAVDHLLGDQDDVLHVEAQVGLLPGAEELVAHRPRVGSQQPYEW